MEKKREKNRWLMLFCICCNTFCYGGLYAWSAFSGEMANYMGWAYSDVTVAYSLQLIVLAVMGIVGGVLFQKFGARLMVIAGIVWGMGWFLTGFSGSIPMLYITFGVLTGCASACGYTPGTITAVKWFPDKKGFASGMAVGVCGVASLLVAPLANFLLTKFNVMTAFKIIGVIFLVLSVGTTWYISDPPADYKPEGYEPPANATAASGKNWKEMLRDPRAYLLWATLLCASVGGLMLIGHASKIGQEVAGLTGAQAALLVGIMAVANFCGRLILGTLSDKLGRYTIVCGTMIVAAIDMIVMSQVTSYFAFVICICIVSICFSGTLATFSALSADVFGAKYSGLNYSIIFTGYGVAGIVGPNVATTIQTASGSYNGAFVFAAGCSIVAAALCFLSKQLNKKFA